MSSQRERTVIAGATILFLAIVSWLGTTTEAVALACGDVITEDTTLEHDLLDCPGDGLIIGADGITLHLNGHMISHLGPPSDTHLSLAKRMAESTIPMDQVIESARSEPAGIAVDGKSHVAILGPGVVRGFFSGSFLEFADRIRISGITFVNNVIGVVLTSETRDSLVDANTFAGFSSIDVGTNDAGVGPNNLSYNVFNRGGIHLSDDGWTHVFFNQIFNSGISMSLSIDNIVNGNAIFGDLRIGIGGIALFKAAQRNKISNNQMNQSIRIFEEAHDNSIYLNVVQDASVGVDINDASGNVVEANRLLDNDDQINDTNESIIRDNFCDPPDEDPPCSTNFDPGEVVDSDVDSVLDRDDECPDSNLQAAVVINGIDTNLANRLMEQSGCTMMDLIQEAAAAAQNRNKFIRAVALLTRSWIDEDLIDEEDAGIIRRAASGSPLF